jgi:hypothetical protein
LKNYFFFFPFFLSISFFSGAQETAIGNQLIDEFLRRKSIIVKDDEKTGWMLRTSSSALEDVFYPLDSISEEKRLFDFKLLPLNLSSRLDGKRPYVGGEYGMIPGRGAQGFLSAGVHFRFSILHIQLQPEIVTAQNLPFQGFPDTFSSGTTAIRFLYWNVSDSPERFGNETYTKVFWGQSSLSLRKGAIELGVGTKNFWWGPGQWNSLIFSNNAPGFPYISLNTIKPAKTFFGHFEGQVLIGRLEPSGFPGSQSEDLNSRFFKPLNPDWRYINAFMLSYSPKWIPNLSIGMARSFLQYGEFVKPTFSGLLPMFEPFQKEKFFQGGDCYFCGYDTRENDKSQQATAFARFLFPKRKGEVYFQFGRRDHAFNWREFILNPEHARAYQFGFVKLTKLASTSKLLQFRGEITHQQESVNRNMRYSAWEGISWHTHGDKRGFGNLGQPLGVGIGTGSNVQTLEFSLVENWKKWGILFERLENNQDFYNKAFGQKGEIKPWIDWTTALLWNTSYKDFLISARLQGTYARNYQWGISEISTPEFPVSRNLFSIHSQVNLIYFWGRGLNNNKGVKRLPSAGN